MTATTAMRVLVVDDDPGVREAYRRMLGGGEVAGGDDLAAAAADLFGEPAAPAAPTGFELVFADQGLAGVAAAAAAVAAGRPFAVAFVDMRMPPGIDGATTIERLWQADPGLQVVLATAYSDTPWAELRQRLGGGDRFVILRKPFEAIEARQLAETLCRKRALAEELRGMLAGLEATVAARTAELQRAVVAAEAAARAKADFLAHMSHEVRTPLTAILGFTELLRDPALTEAARLEHIDVIERNGSHLLAVLNDILDLSKLDAGQLLVERLPTHLPGMLSEVASLMRPRASQKQLGFDLVYIGGCPQRIETDPTRLRQVLLNLVGNAIKFTESGAITVRVGTTRGDDGRAQLRIDVNDTGIGMTEPQRQLLFQAFVQGDTSTSRRFGGTGLGLAISRRLARLLGGDIEVQSEAGRGSTFSLFLPVGEAGELTMLQSVAESAVLHRREKAPLPTLHGRVLLVEDGADNQRLIATILRKAGAEVVTADHGQAALDRIAAGEDFDLVLMDMLMPVLDGHAATRELRARGFQRPIVALTAHAMEGERERCLADGCNAYETKPVRVPKLLACCAQQLALRGPGPGGTGPA